MPKGNPGRKREPLSPEHRRKISESNKGRSVSPSTREKIANGLRGIKRKPLSEEAKLNLSWWSHHRQELGLPCGAIKIKTLEEKIAFVAEQGLWDTSYGRRIAREVMKDEPKICFFCKNQLDYKRWMVHHLNGNESDNRRENLAWAHSHCHKSDHSAGHICSDETKQRMRHEHRKRVS